MFTCKNLAVSIKVFSIKILNPKYSADHYFLNSLLDDKILNWSKLKEIADYIFKCIKIGKKKPHWVENVLRKGEIACYKSFLKVPIAAN